MAKEKENLDIFTTLSGSNVSKHTKTKDTGSAKLSYLSWAKAWELLKHQCPDATYEIVKNSNNLPYFADDLGIMVYTKMTINGLTYEMWLSVMDGANRALKTTPYTVTKNGRDGRPYEQTVPAATMNDINKTVMRCLVKNMAMFGLGLHVYEGEYIPMLEVEAYEAEQKEANVNTVCGYARMAESAEALQSLWVNNPTYQKEDAFKVAMLTKVQELIKAAPSIGELKRIYATSVWAQPIAEFTDMCTSRKIDLMTDAV